MSALRPLAVAGAVLAAAVTLVPTQNSLATPARPDTVQITVDDLQPLVPVATSARTPLVVSLTLLNTTATPLNNVRIDGERGDPLETQSGLDQSIKQGMPSATGGVPIPAKQPVTVDLPPKTPVDVTFSTWTSTQDHIRAICLCTAPPTPDGVYPLYFSAHATGTGGVDQELGVGATYLPSFIDTPKPAPLQVSWVWPLLDAPHRLLSSSIFTDDALASEVAAPDGRLSRALAVAEQVGSTVPMTLLIDPELLDELAVMASGKYEVSSPTGKAVAGTGQQAAADWLTRFHNLLTDDSDVQVQLTAYGDPDVQSLTQRGVSWSATMPAAMADRVGPLLAGRALDTALAWPAGGAIGGSTLDALVADGVSTVLLSSTAVDPKPPADAVSPGLARLRVASQDVAVGLLNPTLENDVTEAVSVGGTNSAALPTLTAELAIRSAQDPATSHAVILTPPRYVDPDVSAAARTILETSKSVFAAPIGLTTAVDSNLVPNGNSRLAAVPASAAAHALPDRTLDAIGEISNDLPDISALLDPTDPTAQALVTALPAAVQRTESSAWRKDGDPLTGVRLADRLRTQVRGVLSGVHILRPSSGSYTLASSNSPLPITVQNDLPYSVRVVVEVSPKNGLLGFTANAKSAEIDARSKRVLRLSTSVQRTGRIQVNAYLFTPSTKGAPTGTQLGAAVLLTIRSTALGLVGVIITIVAGVVLAAALLWRLRWRFRRRRPAPREQPPTPEDALVLPPDGRIPVDEPEHAP